ncbi:MAG: response regulator transcription factor [Negativicutes bacterium]|nr:response regulator transcription factor [Negativicutes bacterium]
MSKVLIVEDEANIRQLVKYNLEKESFQVIEAEDGLQGLRLAKAEKPDLVLLDLMLPQMDGLEVCRSLKGNQATAALPIIMLTAKSEEIDKVIGLELGADDYMTKPFSPRELVARVKAVLRRSQKEAALPGELSVGRLRFNFSRYEVHMGNAKLELTPKEYELLKMLATNLGKVFTREQLLEKVWGYEYFGDTRTVDVHVRHLRAKMSTDPETADALETIRGFGYRLRELE